MFPIFIFAFSIIVIASVSSISSAFLTFFCSSTSCRFSISSSRTNLFLLSISFRSFSSISLISFFMNAMSSLSSACLASFSLRLCSSPFRNISINCLPNSRFFSNSLAFISATSFLYNFTSSIIFLAHSFSRSSSSSLAFLANSI
uniref:Uncharacterized protein n=1 Tax=Panstrongylus lignarius TaxID=156445 RepID=A0A224XNB3_9HEMI